MKKNYDALPRRLQSILWPSGVSKSGYEDRSDSAFAKKNQMLFLAALFMFAAQSFAQTSYCVPAPTSVDNLGIINVNIGSINNASVAEPTRYGDYSSQIANVGQGVAQPFSITFSTGFTYDTKIWVDWNNDFDFTDEGEQVYYGTSTATRPSVLSGTFTVPVTATLGNHRLRIGGLDTGGANGVNVTPCYSSTYGTYEDYTINVTTPPTCFVPSALIATNVGAGNVNISWAAPTLGTTPTGYQYVVDAVATAPTVDGTATTGTSATNVAAPVNVNGYLHVRTNCGSGDYSEWVTVSFYNGVCIPRPTSVDGTGITNVTIGSINNTTGSEANNYGNYSAQIVNVGQGVTQPFSITFSTGYDYNTKIWVDWNDDLDFDDEGEQVYYGTSLAPNPYTLSGTFTVPLTATLGNHRLRIGGLDSGGENGVNVTPCYAGAYGSYEDYTINVTTPPSCFTPTNAIATVTGAGTANFVWEAPALGGTPAGYEYIVDTLPTAPANGTTATATTTPGVTGYTGFADSIFYYLHVRTSCGNGQFSEWITSPRFRYLQGDTCASAISLDALTSPLQSTTVGANSDYTPTCSFSTAAPDVFYSITVPNGYTLVAGLDASNYSTITSMFYGSCDARTAISCLSFTNDDTTWENTTGSTQTVYWVQDGYGSGSGTFTLAWTLTAPPECNIPRALSTQLTSATSVNVSWSVPVTSTPIGYEYAVNTTATPPTTGTPTTATSVTGITVSANETTYLHVRSKCGENSFSTWVTYTFYTGYCTPAPTSVDGIGITNVTIGSINNTTTDEDDQYGDYSAQIANVGQGVVQPFSITYSTGFTYDTKIWVDWNDDFDFDDAGEQVYFGTSANTNPTTLSGTFTVPATASLGNHRMRIGGLDAGGTDGVNVTPCYSGTYGSYEDYTINVTTPPACFVPSALTVTNVSGGVVNISWTAPVLGNTPAGYEYLIDATNTSPTVSGTAVTETSLANITVPVNVTSYLHVRTNCGEGSYSEWVTISFYNGVCIPRPTSVDGQGITNVTIGNINNTTTGEANNYGNYSAQVVNIGQGVAQPFSITFSTGFTYDTKIWVDWNNDLDFDDEGEQVFFGSSANTNPTTLTGTITVPTDAALGNHRLRIGGLDNGGDNGVNITPCYTGGYGTFEDYTVNVTIPPTCFTPSALTAVNAGAGFVNISWSAPTLGTTPAGYEYVVDTVIAAPTVNGTATTTTSATNVAAPLNVTGYLHVRANCGNGDYSEWVTISFYNGICIPRPTSVDGQGITNVSIGSINNTTAAEPNNYGNYSAQVVNVGQGVTQPFSITFSTGFTYDTKIWVDWNDDLDFDDEGEQVYFGSSTGDNPTTLSGTFTVPVTATLGNHRLRIGGLDAGGVNGANVTPCYTGSYGSYEDYTINVTTPPSCFTPTNAVAFATAENTATLTWTAPTLGGAAVGYEYVVDTTSAAPTVSGTTTTGTTVTGYTGIVSNTYYYLHVRTNCGNGDYSEWITSPRFRYLAGDTCETAVSLDNVTTPYTFSTEGAANDYTPSCATFGTAPDLFYSVTVPNGYTLTMGLEDSDYSAATSMFYGNCTTRTDIGCLDYSDENTTWENLTGSTQTVYWVQDGMYGDSGSFTLTWTLGPPPACDVPRAPQVNLTSLTTANISWTVPNTGSPTGYEYAITTSEADPVANITPSAGTSVNNVTVTPNVAQYLHVRSVCGPDQFSEWVNIPFFSGYCVPSNTTGTTFYITSITTTGGSTNIATSSPAFSGFTDYTATQTVTTYAGGSFTIQATTPNTTDDFLYSVFVDWNNDFDFEDQGERVLNSSVRLTSPAIVGTLNVPVNVAQGTYRMRIRNAHVGSPVPACGENASGEAEDYTLVIEATPACVAPFNLTITPTDAGFADLRWSPSLLGSPAAGYEYVFGPSSTPPADGVSGIPSTSFFVGGAEYDPTQSVYLFVRSICGANEFSEWSAPASVLDLVSPELLSNSVVVYKDGNAINITSGTTQLTGVTIYDTRGRKLYTQSVNSNNAVINDLQIQQQVIILEINTTKGTVSKRIIF